LRNLFKLEKIEPKKNKKKQAYVPVYLDLPEVHTNKLLCNLTFRVVRSATSTDPNFFFAFSFFVSPLD
jgi:hypothetical protein